MPDGWRRVPLAALFRPVDDRLGVYSVEPPVFSLSKHHGVVFASDYFDRRIASARLDAYKLLRPGDWAYSTIHIDEGSIGRNNLGVAGVLSPMYTTMRWASASDDPQFVEQLLRSPAMLSEYRTYAKGTVNRRRSLSFPSFARIPIDLPTLDEQRRIVDLLGSADTLMRSAESLLTVATRALGAYLHGMYHVSHEERELEEVAELASGPSWKAGDESMFAGPGRSAVVGITATPAGTSIVDASRRTFVGGLPPSTRVLSTSAIVMIRTNGNRARIGNVYRVPAAAVGYAYSAFQIGIFPRDPRDSSYLYWFLASPAVQERISDAASGSTGLGNIAQSWLKRMRVPWPDPATRAQIVEMAAAIDEIVARGRDVSVTGGRLRSSLLTDLLSGERVIGPSYDRLLDGPA